MRLQPVAKPTAVLPGVQRRLAFRSTNQPGDAPRSCRPGRSSHLDFCKSHHPSLQIPPGTPPLAPRRPPLPPLTGAVNPADAVASRRARRLVRGIAVGLILVGVLAAASWGLIWLSNGRLGIPLTGLPPALSNIVLGIACLLALKQGKRAQVASRLLALLDLGMMGVWLGVEASIPYEWTPEQWYRSAPDVGFSTAALAACLLLRGSSRI